MIVDLGISSCTCNMWGLTGIPCEHAVACMAFRNVEPEDFVHQLFSVQLWRKTYEPYVRPINSSEYWCKTGLPAIDPPPFKRPAGRPKKQRKKVNDPPPNPKKPQKAKGNDPLPKPKKTHKAKRKYGEIKCSKCGGTKHNSRTCKAPPPTSNNQSTSNVLPTPPPSSPPMSQDLSQSSQDCTNNSNITKSIYLNYVRPPPLRPASMPPTAVRPPPLRPASLYNETIQAASYATRSRLSKFIPPQPSNAGHE
ncbi:WAS/WASL-interacting protein family member 1-like [Senna tora]|uniref:WAS/WASL-interacting protein family member 1-like n=1 Tax=Senna tora TaxID=362788 RepID=A0A834XBH4_9FABA|nr:WAS/WASL-interacting protein family member 1-like [Senna tora]